VLFILTVQDLKIVFEDEHIIVVDKPAGVLCVPTKEVSASLSQAVFDAYGCESGNMNSMVVHRLGMETSGLVVFARSKSALLALNTAFRTRNVSITNRTTEIFSYMRQLTVISIWILL